MAQKTMQAVYANRISYWGSQSRTVGDEMRVLKFTPPTNLIINKLCCSWSRESGTKSQDKWHCWISSGAIAVWVFGVKSQELGLLWLLGQLGLWERDGIYAVSTRGEQTHSGIQTETRQCARLYTWEINGDAPPARLYGETTETSKTTMNGKL